MTEFTQPTPAGPLLAFVLLADSAPTIQTLEDALTAEFGEVMHAQLPDMDGEPDASALVVPVNGSLVIVTPLAEPYEGDVEGTCHPVWWPDGPAAAHQSQVLLTVVRQPSEPIDRADVIAEAVALSSVGAIVCELPGAVALHNASAAVTLPALPFASLVRTSLDSGRLPTEAWVSVWFSTIEPDALSAFTLGLPAFCHADLTVRDSRREASEVYGFLVGLADHIASSGDSLEPGMQLVADDGDSLDVTDVTERGHHLLCIDY